MANKPPNKNTTHLNPPPKPTKQPPPGSHLPTRDTTTRPHHPPNFPAAPRLPNARRQADEAAQVLQDELRKLIEVAELETQMAEVPVTLLFDGDVRRFGFDGGGGVYRGSFKKNVGEGGKEGNLTRKVGVCL